MTIEDLKKKIEYGDYNTLGKMLNTSPATSKARLTRGDKEAAEAMTIIIATREKMIYDFQNR